MQALEKLLALPIRVTGTLARAPPLILQPNGGLIGEIDHPCNLGGSPLFGFPLHLPKVPTPCKPLLIDVWDPEGFKTAEADLGVGPTEGERGGALVGVDQSEGEIGDGLFLVAGATASDCPC